MSTFMAKPATKDRPATVQQNWYVIDATDQVVGRLAVVVSNLLRGKHKPEFTPHCDTGDFVIVVNADKVKFTGNKWQQKTYQRYSHYTGGQKVIPALEMLEKKPEEILRLAVKRMMPRGPLAYKQITKLKIFAGPAHDHQAQKPVEFKLPTA
jgi:large subunit ribosomal protein L13